MRVWDLIENRWVSAILEELPALRNLVKWLMYSSDLKKYYFELFSYTAFNRAHSIFKN